jgi:hypothetical protein
MTIGCQKCGKLLPPVEWNGKYLTQPDLGKRLVELATKPLTKYDLWCVDCILDEECRISEEDNG